MTLFKIIGAGILISSLTYKPAIITNNKPLAEYTQKATGTIPNIALRNAKGENVNLTSFKGKKVFVNLWATWCGPCRREMPSIASLAAKVKKSKVEFVMLSVDDEFNKAINYITSSKIDLPVYYPTDNLPPLFSVDAIPTTFVFNEKGELIKTIQGSVNYDTEEFVNLLTK